MRLEAEISNFFQKAIHLSRERSKFCGENLSFLQAFKKRQE